LTVPAFCAIMYWFKRDLFSFALSGIWFFQNFHSIARYMADARALKLPLLFGTKHDWNGIFGHFGLLEYDVRIAYFVNITGIAGLVFVTSWFVWRWYEDNVAAVRETKSELNGAGEVTAPAARAYFPPTMSATETPAPPADPAPPKAHQPSRPPSEAENNGTGNEKSPPSGPADTDYSI